MTSIQQRQAEPVANNTNIHSQDEQVLNSDHEGKYLAFNIGKEIFAVDVILIKEIIDKVNITRVPMVSQNIEGVINMRGNVVPVINMAHRFGRRFSEDSRTKTIIVVDRQTSDGLFNIGMLVDAVDEVVSISDHNIEKAPEFGSKIRSSFLQGIGKLNNRFLMLLDLQSVLDVEELAAHVQEIA